MDHEIEHDADVGAASRVGGEPVGLDEAGAGQLFLERVEGGVEALDVADLEHEFLGLGERDERLGLLGVVGDRFLDEDVFAEREEERADLVMRDGGRGDGGGVDLLGELAGGGEGLHAVGAARPFRRHGRRGRKDPTNWATPGSVE